MTFCISPTLLLLHSRRCFFFLAIYWRVQVKWFFIKAPWDLHQQTHVSSQLLDSRCVKEALSCATHLYNGLTSAQKASQNSVGSTETMGWLFFPSLLFLVNYFCLKLQLTEYASDRWVKYTVTNAWKLCFSCVSTHSSEYSNAALKAELGPK